MWLIESKLKLSTLQCCDVCACLIRDVCATTHSVNEAQEGVRSSWQEARGSWGTSAGGRSAALCATRKRTYRRSAPRTHPPTPPLHILKPTAVTIATVHRPSHPWWGEKGGRASGDKTIVPAFILSKTSNLVLFKKYVRGGRQVGIWSTWKALDKKVKG